MGEQLYLLGGMFQDSEWGSGGFPFAGYFRKFDKQFMVSPQDLPFEKPREYNLKGQLIDQFGHSDILGVLEKKTLVFNKNYPNAGNEFVYEFKNKEGLWIGKWHGIKRYKGNGIATANLQLFADNPNFVKVQTLNPGNVEEFVDYLVREGFIKPVDEIE